MPDVFLYTGEAPVGDVRLRDPTVADAPIVQAALDWSLRIRHEQQANRLWYADLFSPDGWNRIEPIAFPCEETP